MSTPEEREKTRLKVAKWRARPEVAERLAASRKAKQVGRWLKPPAGQKPRWRVVEYVWPDGRPMVVVALRDDRDWTWLRKRTDALGAWARSLTVEPPIALRTVPTRLMSRIDAQMWVGLRLETIVEMVGNWPDFLIWPNPPDL